MHRVVLLLLLLGVFTFVQAQETPMTPAECLFKYDESSIIYNRQNLVNLPGREVGHAYLDILPEAEMVGEVEVRTDTGYRMMWWYLYQGEMYLFVFRHEDGVGAKEGNAWHGSCMLRMFVDE